MVSSISNDNKLHHYNSVSNNLGTVNFRAKNKNLERYPNSDTVDINHKKKKKKSLLSRLGIGFAAGVVTLLTTMILISKSQTRALTKLYKEKIVYKELPEKIKFKEAKTLDEAIKFSKETLGIEKIDKDISLEALNFANRGMVDVSNANKGKLFIPKEIIDLKTDKTWIAAVDGDIKSDHFGALLINQKYFSHEYLDKSLKDLLYKDGKKIFTDPKIGLSYNKYKNIYLTPKNEFYNNIQKFYKSPNSLTINQKRELFYGQQEALRNLGVNAEYTPDKLYEIIIKHNGSQKYSLKDYKSFDIVKQREILTETLKKKPIFLDMHTSNGIRTIYHEMGHLQDFAKNLKELDSKFWDFDIVKISKEAWSKAKNSIEKGIKSNNQNKASIKYIDNRWGGSRYDGYKELLKNDPEKFKKYYPDLHEHLTNRDIQDIAGQVSGYAKTGIGEFIAEVYAGLVQGKKYSKEVINLYKKYGGPLLPGM